MQIFNALVRQPAGGGQNAADSGSGATGSQGALAMAIRIEHQLTASWNPTCQWVPSQNGLFFDAPQRHRV